MYALACTLFNMRASLHSEHDQESKLPLPKTKSFHRTRWTVLDKKPRGKTTSCRPNVPIYRAATTFSWGCQFVTITIINWNKPDSSVLWTKTNLSSGMPEKNTIKWRTTQTVRGGLTKQLFARKIREHQVLTKKEKMRWCLHGRARIGAAACTVPGLSGSIQSHANLLTSIETNHELLSGNVLLWSYLFCTC